MTKVYVSEYSVVPLIPGLSAEPPVATQIIDYSAGVASVTLGASTRYVRLNNDSICSISFTATNAATTDARSPAETIEYKAVQPGSKISAITNT